MEQQYSQGDDWLARRTGARRGDAEIDLDGLREDIEAYPAQPGSWEAACLKNIANLLESLEQARTEQATLSGRLADTRAKLTTTETERDEFETRVAEFNATDRATRDLEKERDDLLESLDNMTAELAEVREQRRAEIEEQRKREEDREGQLTGLREALAQVEVEREEWDAALARVRSSQQDLDETRESLAMAVRERDALAENARDTDAMRRKIETLREECEEFERAREDSLVETCDLRVQVNRLEHDIEEERDQRRRKVKKILAKIHGELDEAGAPRGEDLSFGERVRWLRHQIDGR